ncbi:hypothetical protein ACFO1B_51525 [Dactylosporangium siamense]|uniref:Uncharacterized protein n=1 Tax=Dactylosporangium siamense TaxID=685454 RepID=A0A919PGH3_9ACTN|nr:hypothetical protein [Dactylosporangium siamense]GIG43747.1 hypothetical protein Dsi01nite_017880 [Dactylosporangium siamense]
MINVGENSARRPSRWIVALAGIGGAAALGLHSGQGALGVEATVAATMVALILHLVIHEGGHLLIALLTGLKVTGVQISLRAGHQSKVTVRPKPSQAGLPARMVAFILGGPLANLGCAALTYQLAMRPMPVLARYALLAAAITGAVFGSGNLLPFRVGSGQRSDGANLLRWTFRSGQARAELDRGQRLIRTVQTVKNIAGGNVDTARLDTILAKAEDPLVLLAAFVHRWGNGFDTDNGQLIADAERLSAIAHDKDTHPVRAGLIAGQLATFFGMSHLHAAIVHGKPVDRPNADEIIELGELGVRLRDTPDTRIGLAVTRLLDHRPEEARTLLVGIRPGTATPAADALALQVRAVAELYLGDHAQADRLVAAVGKLNPAIREMLTVLRAPTAGRPPTLVQPDPA